MRWLALLAVALASLHTSVSVRDQPSTSKDHSGFKDGSPPKEQSRGFRQRTRDILDAISSPRGEHPLGPGPGPPHFADSQESQQLRSGPSLPSSVSSLLRLFDKPARGAGRLPRPGTPPPQHVAAPAKESSHRSQHSQGSQSMREGHSSTSVRQEDIRKTTSWAPHTVERGKKSPPNSSKASPLGKTAGRGALRRLISQRRRSSTRGQQKPGGIRDPSGGPIRHHLRAEDLRSFASSGSRSGARRLVGGPFEPHSLSSGGSSTDPFNPARVPQIYQHWPLRDQQREQWYHKVAWIDPRVSLRSESHASEGGRQY